MNPLIAAIRRAADDLNRSGQRWALVGGFAVSARVEPRFTRDVDVAIMVDGDESATVGHLIALKILARDDRTRGWRVILCHGLSRVSTHQDKDHQGWALLT